MNYILMFKTATQTLRKNKLMKNKYTPQEIENKVKKIFEEQFGISSNEVTLDKDIAVDFGADSLDNIELIMAIEDEFSTDFFYLEITDEDAEKCLTVKNVVDLVIKLLESKVNNKNKYNPFYYTLLIITTCLFSICFYRICFTKPTIIDYLVVFISSFYILGMFTIVLYENYKNSSLSYRTLKTSEHPICFYNAVTTILRYCVQSKNGLDIGMLSYVTKNYYDNVKTMLGDFEWVKLPGVNILKVTRLGNGDIRVRILFEYTKEFMHGHLEKSVIQNWYFIKSKNSHEQYLSPYVLSHTESVSE